MLSKRALGKGLQALLPYYTDTNDNSIIEININDIEPNLGQPRKHFEEDSLEQLAQSIKEVGIIQPVLVKKEGSVYRLVAGERRWRAARQAGLKTVPAILKELSELESMEIALIENLQREDLNPIEEALGYERLVAEYQMTQDQISEIVCKSRSAIANSLRLLKLSKTIQDLLVSRKISSGHARALLSVDDESIREKLADEITLSGLNVRQIEEQVRDKEALIKLYSAEKQIERSDQKGRSSGIDERAIALDKIESELEKYFSANVKMISNGEKGRIVISFYNDEHLQKILDAIGMKNIF
jgi:ParB family chromosome partitioning protein